MSGMLPGVELARIRRLHHQGGNGWSRSNLTGAQQQRYGGGIMNDSRSRLGKEDETLGQMARQAKARLEHRLFRVKWKSDITTARGNSDLGSSSTSSSSGRTTNTTMNRTMELRTEVFGSAKKNKKKSGFFWPKKLGGLKADQQQQDCAICLDRFTRGDNLVKLPCSHRFHSRCLLPWLNTKSHCPLCRSTAIYHYVDC